jgi:hypothetical protein
MVQTDVINALASKVYNLFNGGPPSDPATDVFISFVNGGYPYSPDDLSFLEPGVLTPGAQPKIHDKAKFFATQMNRIPSNIGNWKPTAGSLTQPYDNAFLRNAIVPNNDPTPEQKKRYDDAVATMHNLRSDYTTYRGIYRNAKDDLTTLQSIPVDQRPADYPAQLRHKQDALNDSFQDWQDLGYKDEYENAESVKKSIATLGYTKLKTDIENQYDAIRDQFKDSNGVNYLPIFCIPPDFYKSDVIWNTFTFAETEINTYSHNSRENWGASLDLNGLFWGSKAEIETHESTDKKQYDVSTTNLQISFDYTRVSLDRSEWFDTYLLTSRSWWWNGATRQNPTSGGPTFSDGANPLNTRQGTWQMIPTDVIFTKNLNVKLDMSNQHTKDVITEVSGNAHAGFWFWTVKTNYQYTDTRHDYNLQSTNEGIIAPQMQIIGFICQLFPKVPNPDPNLLPP